MSQVGGFPDKSYKAGADLDTTTTQYRAAALNSAGSVVVANSVGARCIGVIQNHPNAGTGASVWVRSFGFSKLYVQDSIASGAIAIVGASGAIPAPASATGATIVSIIGRNVGIKGNETGTLIEVLLLNQTMPGTLTTAYD